MKTKRTDIFAGPTVILIIAILVMVNLVSSRLFGRLDLTENRAYTLSPVTKQILRELPDKLTIKAYFTRDLPAPYNTTARNVEDQLAEMKAFSRGKLRFEVLDPADEEKLKAEAEKFRLEPIQVNEMRADKMEFKLAYLGMALIYQDKQEVIPAIQSLGNLEYEIVSKIRRITAARIPTVGFLEGHGEKALRQDMTGLDREIRKLYNLKPVSLSSRSDIPEDIDLLCIIGPSEDIPEKDRYAIDQFLMRGGKLFIAANRVATDLSQMSAERGAQRWDAWTEHYGFKINEDLVMDRLAPTLPFQTMTRWGRQITMVSYPLFPEVIQFDRENAALKALRQVRFYFPSSIDTSPAVGKSNLSLTTLFRTSEKSSIQSMPFDINPLTQRGKGTWEHSGIPLGVLIQGRFTSYWAGKDAPLDSEGNPVTTVPVTAESPETRIVVIGDANFIHDQYIVPGLDNLTMALNLIDWLAQDEQLITIRSREVTSRPIGEVTDATRNTVKTVNLAIPPLLVLFYGLARWRMRKATRKQLMQGARIGTGRKEAA
ncbi:MAG: hypothetical protein FJY67_09955 [Calditrichaeota bacterium]|nr:hypothetical protein [Calditrichota bacterium]